MAKVTITIETGNDAMQTADDVMSKLRRMSNGAAVLSTLQRGGTLPLYDTCGNKVGRLHVSEPLEDEYTDPENIYGVAGIRQSIEEERK